MTKVRQPYLNKNDNKIFNVLLISAYFAFFLLLIRYSVTEDNIIYLFIGLLPVFIISYVSLNNSVFSLVFKEANKYIIWFYIIYYALYCYNFSSPSQAFILICIILMQISIFSLAITSPGAIKINYLVGAILVITVVVVFIPTYLIVGSLKLGSFYNTTNKSLLTVTTLDAPLISGMLFVLAVYDLIFNKKYTALNIFSTVFSGFILLLFSRRGFIFSAAITIGFYSLYRIFNKRWMVYVLISFLLLPMFWNTIATLLLSFSDSTFFSSIIARNDTESITNATGRLFTWTNILDIFFQFKSKYLFGFHGKIPDDLFIQIEGEKGRYSHAHNTFLQLFLEGGYFMNVVFIGFLVSCFWKYVKARKLVKNDENFYFIILIFLLNLAATETLVRNIQFTNFIFCFVLVGFNVKNVMILKEYEMQNNLRNKNLSQTQNDYQVTGFKNYK